jgi:hypothetical protein
MFGRTIRVHSNSGRGAHRQIVIASYRGKFCSFSGRPLLATDGPSDKAEEVTLAAAV